MKNTFCRICGSRIQTETTAFRHNSETGKPTRVLIIIRCPNSTVWIGGHDLHYYKHRTKKVKYEGQYKIGS